MMARICFAVTLRLRSPFLFRDSAGAAFGVDTMTLRDAYGRPIIPADQLRGVLRDALEDIGDCAPGVLARTDLETLFGRGSADTRKDDVDDASADFEPQRGGLLCGDLVAVTAGQTLDQAVRVEIAPETGAARPGHLLVAELCAPPGQEVDFEGVMVALVPESRANAIADALAKAARMLVAIGAQKSVGFGEIVTAAITRQSARPLSLPSAPPEPTDRVAYRITFDRPFLVDATREADNLYVGSEVVPGAVVKGALARRLELAGEDPRTGRFAGLLSAITVSHAFPETVDGKPAGHALPLSLVMEQTETGIYLLADSLGTPSGKGVLFKGPPRRPARYMPDWKEHAWIAEARSRLGRPAHPEVGRELRVHTAIARATGAADEGRLYAASARAHRFLDQQSGAATGALRGWRMTVTAPKGHDPALFGALLALLEQGLDGIGRTGASIHAERLTDSEAAGRQAKPVAGNAHRFAVVLTTPAVMTGPDPQVTARDAYAAYWSRILPGARLLDHAAQQRLAGGYLARRRRPYGATYVPFVLTEPGSAFLLDGVDAASLEQLMRTGLPVAPLGPRPLDWRTCPFVPENGFGAFTADHLAEPVVFDEIEHV